MASVPGVLFVMTYDRHQAYLTPSRAPINQFVSTTASSDICFSGNVGTSALIAHSLGRYIQMHNGALIGKIRPNPHLFYDLGVSGADRLLLTSVDLSVMISSNVQDLERCLADETYMHV